MKKTLLELQDERLQLKNKADAMIELASTEKRKLTDDEDSEYRKIASEISLLNSMITVAEIDERKDDPAKVIVKEKREMKNNLLLRSLNAMVSGGALPEEMRKISEYGKEEMRKSGLEAGNLILPVDYRADILAGTATAGQEVVSEQKMALLEPLRAALVTAQAGATLLTGLVGDVSIPVYAGTTALWKGEVAAAVDGGGAFSEVTMAPKRLTTFINVSKQFLIQDSVAANEMLMRDIVNAVAGKLEATIFGKEDVSATQPLGLFFTAPTTKGAASWANMVALETAIDTSNALMGNLKYITNAPAKGKLKTTVKVAAQALYLMDGDTMNGYPVLTSNHVASALQVGGDEYGIVFANWADLMIGQWGGFDITVDPYTLAKNGQVQIVINAYFDAKFRRTASYATGSLK